MEQITVPMTAPPMDRHAPLRSGNGARTMLPLSWLGRETLVEFTSSDGTGVSTSATLLNWRGLEIICALAAAPSIVAWDARRIVQIWGG